MELAMQKAFVFILLMALGLLLKKKIDSKEQLTGIKTVILSIALPATIFIALLKIEIKPNLMLLPVIALVVNIALFLGTKLLVKILGFSHNSSRARTLLLLVPSFAPGLSCFPFIVEFLGEESLAIAAFADVGNKVFVLIILYLLAMHWHYLLKAQDATKDNSRLKDLGLSLLSEPINMVMMAAIAMLCLHLNLQNLPIFLQDSISRMSVLMTPLVLIFIGMAVNIQRQDIVFMLQIVLWRSGFAFLISAVLLALLPTTLPIYFLLLAVIFPQSACSFWPYAHITAINTLEKEVTKEKTFDLDLGLNLLACSLPFSTIVVLIVCSTGNFFADSYTLTGVGLSLIGIVVLSVIPFTKEVLQKVTLQKAGE